MPMKGLTAAGRSSGKAKAPFEDGEESRSGRGASPNWWAPVWKGLCLDRDGRHYGKIKSALWLLIYFFLCADRRTGILKRKLLTITRETGIKSRTIRTWLDMLRKGGYIKTERNGRCLTIVINKWKTLPDGHCRGMESDGFPAGRVTEKRHSERALEGQETLDASHNQDAGSDGNDNTIKKYKLRNDNVTTDVPLNHFSIESMDAQHDHRLLAYSICTTFNDEKNLPMYLSYVRKYPLEIIQRACEGAARPQAHKIKRTRGALFNYLVKRYAKENAF